MKEYTALNWKEQSHNQFMELPHRKVVLRLVEDDWVKKLPYWDLEKNQIANLEGWKVLTVTNTEKILAGTRVPKNTFKEVLAFGKDAMSYNEFMEQHYQSKISPLTDVLPSVQEVINCTGNNPGDRTDTKPWFDSLPEEKDPINKISMKELVNCLLSVSYSGSCHLLKECILFNDVDGHSYAHPLPDNGQGVTLRVHAIPMASRTSDVGTIALMNTCLPDPELWEERAESDGILVDKFGMDGDKATQLNVDKIPLNRYCRFADYSRDSPSFLNDWFRATMSAIYGEISGLTSYFKYGRPAGGGAIPTPQEAENFAKHMERTYKDNIANNYQSQYKGQIPEQATTLGTATSFIRTLGTEWNQLITDLLKRVKYTDKVDINGNVIPADRAELILGLAKILADKCPGDASTAKFVFVASQSICGMEDVYGRIPFGEVLPCNTPLGPGLKGCLKILKKLKSCKRKGKKERNKGVTWMDELLDEETFESITQTMEKLMEDQLTILLLFWDDNDKILRSMMNGHPMNSVDVEHFLCKAYILVRKKSPVVVATLHPSSTSTFCHPVKTSVEKALAISKELVPLFKAAVEAWHCNLPEKGKIWTPVPFLFKHERPLCVHHDNSGSNSGMTDGEKAEEESDEDEDNSDNEEKESLVEGDCSEYYAGGDWHHAPGSDEDDDDESLTSNADEDDEDEDSSDDVEDDESIDKQLRVN